MVSLDPVTNEKSVVKVVVSYPSKPLICTGCCSLGHLVGACPKTTRKWVRKERQDNQEQAESRVPITTPTVHVPAEEVSSKSAQVDVEPIETEQKMKVSTSIVNDDEDLIDGEWQTMEKKKICSVPIPHG